MTARDGHVRVLPLHVANKIAAGEVVERPASVVKELVENAIDAGAKSIKISITQGGRKLVSVQDDGCGMTKDDAVLSLERQATSKILDVHDIEEIDTLGFRGEAIPSIASVSRFSLTTRRHDSDEGTFLQVNAGTLAEVRAAGCPPGTLVEVRDLFCNVPARRKFLRAYVTEENHVKTIFTVHALAHPNIGFSLTIDGRELYRLAPSTSTADRIRDIFGPDFTEALIPLNPNTQTPNNPNTSLSTSSTPNTQTPKHPNTSQIRISGFIERPNLNQPTRRDQYVFVNGRPATAPSIAYAIREAYPRHQGDVRPAVFLFLELPPNQVDVNVHPTKREVRFRDNVSVKNAIITAIESVLTPPTPTLPRPLPSTSTPTSTSTSTSTSTFSPSSPTPPRPLPSTSTSPSTSISTSTYSPTPLEIELPIAADVDSAKPWKWFKFLAATASGYLLIETDTGVVTINPHAARERIAFEQLLGPSTAQTDPNTQPKHPNTQTPKHLNTSQPLLIPETVKMSPVDCARITASLKEIGAMGFAIEPFGADTFKIDAVPQLIGSLSPAAVISTIARDLAEGGARRGDRWREELIAKSIARSFAGMSLQLNEDGAVKLVEELAACRMPYVCPRGKPIMIFTSTRELDRKFAK